MLEVTLWGTNKKVKIDINAKGYWLNGFEILKTTTGEEVYFDMDIEQWVELLK
jgi:hypothetical protein